ncbi:flagellar motor switch protein FliG [Candidatus Haliotispira prima]|uniref:Flagellar motor switch protein FliG n=1 Tax=Candidatus Haliotispira prima TaxID=3034016 RepID=A0ABY8MGB0_9SPIO|nr:flagellar motor switch protein FliG [Candidatus Haliotispira prima]
MAKSKSGGVPSGDEELTGRQKAAIFLVTLGSEISAAIFKHLNQEEVETITFEIARLGNVRSEDRDLVLQEFQEMMMAQDFMAAGGVDYARELLEKSLGSDKAIEIINRLTSSLKSRPFDFVRRADPQHILNFIQQEHPQTIALILSYIEPAKASAVLGGLDPDMQSEVAKRIANMERSSPEVIREVERVLEKKLASISSEDVAVAGGVDSIVEILNTIDRATERSIMESLEEDDPELAEEIRKKMFVFDDIVMLDDGSIQRVLKEVDQQDLTKALKAVDDEVKDKIFRNMSKRAAAMLEEDMQFMGPVRMSDVEEVQQKIVGIIRKLEEAGEVIIARGGDDDLLV